MLIRFSQYPLAYYLICAPRNPLSDWNRYITSFFTTTLPHHLIIKLDQFFSSQVRRPWSLGNVKVPNSIQKIYTIYRTDKTITRVEKISFDRTSFDVTTCWLKKCTPKCPLNFLIFFKVNELIFLERHGVSRAFFSTIARFIAGSPDFFELGERLFVHDISTRRVNNDRKWRSNFELGHETFFSIR